TEPGLSMDTGAHTHTRARTHSRTHTLAHTHTQTHTHTHTRQNLADFNKKYHGLYSRTAPLIQRPSPHLGLHTPMKPSSVFLCILHIVSVCRVAGRCAALSVCFRG